MLKLTDLIKPGALGAPELDQDRIKEALRRHREGLVAKMHPAAVRPGETPEQARRRRNERRRRRGR